ncbi:hypothetical protein LOTGIDRAFT_199898 [Lottia gigantea]|uniref:NADP-dependent oxidoreductase domain-containing protein n=1 Tax=Lottia gigantea TaxID=225164 RepID=V4B8S9_LOTGI|nr:hypothetical protein LOTGIDRAFT_199898 [Lottia gigantea]ESP02247.1 hypothetical protein LOTGIDRAFT_199898 [Lottia gigantea]
MCEVKTFVKDFHDEDSVRDMKYNSLGNTGIQVSDISFGASPLAGVFMPTEEVESIKTVREALKHGINYIDTAPWYGQGKSESVLGKALQDIPRESYYLATKVGRYELQWDKMFDFSAEKTRKSFDDSLQRLGLDYIDVIQVHDMEFAPDLDIIINETLPVLDEIRKSGKAKFIGITGYPLGNFKKVLERSSVKIDIVLSYCHGAMYDDSITEIIPYLKSKGVGIINAAPIGMGLLSNQGPPKWHPGKPETKEACQQAAQYCQVDNEVDICRLAMKHSLNLQGVDTTIVGMERCEVVEKNFIIRKTDLTEHERQIYNDVINKFMKPLNNLNWEGIEVEHYNKKIAALQNQ